MKQKKEKIFMTNAILPVFCLLLTIFGLSPKTSDTYLILQNDYNKTSSSSQYTKMKYFEPYMINLQKKIKSNWYPPKRSENSTVIVKFKLLDTGKAKDLQILKTSKDPLTNIAALDAIKDSQPFAPLPKEYKKHFVFVRFTFDYNQNQ